MKRDADSPADIKANLSEEFPGWSFMRTSAQRWWAFREAERPLPREVMSRPDAIDGDTPDLLRERLREVIAGDKGES